MSRFLLFALAGCFLMTACQSGPSADAPAPATDFKVLTSNESAWEYENLRLYPVVAEVAFIDRQSAAAGWKNLGEAIADERFRITEKKPYGRREDRNAVNTLTVQNKTQDTIFLMAGDVVRGGLQDRVLAADRVIPPRTITDLPVFCVEKGRWHFQEPEEEEPADPIYAFRGYYNVASSDLRRSVRRGDQEAVWETVGQLRARYTVDTPTEAYAGLESSEAFTGRRDAYLAFFREKLREQPTAIGFVAVSGNRILGADLFAHPALFQKQMDALLHGYITDAVTTGETIRLSEEGLENFVKRLQSQYTVGEGRFDFDGLLVHFSQL